MNWKRDSAIHLSWMGTSLTLQPLLIADIVSQKHNHAKEIFAAGLNVLRP